MSPEGLRTTVAAIFVGFGTFGAVGYFVRGRQHSALMLMAAADLLIGAAVYLWRPGVGVWIAPALGGLGLFPLAAAWATGDAVCQGSQGHSQTRVCRSGWVALWVYGAMWLMWVLWLGAGLAPLLIPELKAWMQANKGSPALLGYKVVWIATNGAFLVGVLVDCWRRDMPREHKLLWSLALVMFSLPAWSMYLEVVVGRGSGRDRQGV
jgi:hypothetical protein